MYDIRLHRCNVLPMLALLVSMLSLPGLTLCASAQDFSSAVIATHPLTYDRLDATTGKSATGGATYKASGGVTSSPSGGPVDGGKSSFAKFNGKDGYILTTQLGGVTTAASILTFVNLGALPSKTGHIFYVAGESQNGNDLDLQFEGDDKLHFFTASGGNIAFAPPPGTLLNQWHMIVATLDTATQTRILYWDGKAVATDHGGGRADKSGAFSIGASTVFSGRFFIGGIAETALWNRALKASEVTAIYATANATAPKSGAATGSIAPDDSPNLFPTTAKVAVEDPKGPVKLKRSEISAFLFLSAMQMMEGDCQSNAQHACTLDQMISGNTAANAGRLKYDPRKDPNYTYTVFASGTAWEAHATAKKPGLIGFCFLSRSYPTVMVTYSTTGTAGFVDTELPNRSIEGDSFVAR